MHFDKEIQQIGAEVIHRESKGLHETFATLQTSQTAEVMKLRNSVSVSIQELFFADLKRENYNGQTIVRLSYFSERLECLATNKFNKCLLLLERVNLQYAVELSLFSRTFYGKKAVLQSHALAVLQRQHYFNKKESGSFIRKTVVLLSFTERFHIDYVSLSFLYLLASFFVRYGQCFSLFQ